MISGVSIVYSLLLRNISLYVVLQFFNLFISRRTFGMCKANIINIHIEVFVKT